MVSQAYKNLLRLFESLENRRPYDRLKRMLIISLAIFFIAGLTVAIAVFWGVKTPGYQRGYIDGYRESYKAALEGEHYNVKAGLLNESRGFYNDGYRDGYDEGYPEGQIDRVIYLEREAAKKYEDSQHSETSQNNETSLSHETDNDHETIQGNETSQNSRTSRPREINYLSDD